MKKSLIALAVLAAAGAASAQSSVTLFGIVDATLAYGKADGNGGSNVWRLTNSGYNSSRLGFRGVEDLGGGMSASFWLEAGLNNDDGQGAASNSNNQAIGAFNPGTGANPPARTGTQGLTFNRRSTVSLAGGWGELRLGRDYTPQFWNLTVFDPFGTNGVGTTQTLNSIITGVTAVRASNAIGYFLPGNLGGFYGQAQYYMGENASTSPNGTKNDGSGFGVRLGWANGPFNVALALSETKYATGKVQQNNVAGQWDFGMAKLMGQYVWDKNGNVDAQGWLIGGLFPIGAGEIRAAYSAYKADLPTGSNDPQTDKFALGYVHNLSKRTAIYTTFAWAKNKGGAATTLNGSSFGAGVVNENSTGWDLGVRHSF
jgi:predicted porin